MNNVLYRSRISGTGSYLPEGLITNKYLETLVDTSDEWVRDRTGIKHRHKVKDGQVTSDLAYEAAIIALKEANISANELDMILFATVSPDQIMPNTACVLQSKLKAGDCMALDVSAACSGFVYALAIADQFIKTGPLKNILVVGAEVLTPYVNYKDRDTCILFGDGAGAAVVTRARPDDESTIYSHHLHADGEISDLFVLPAGGSKMPFSQEVLDKELQYVKMKGREIFKHAVRTMSKCCKEALDYNQMSADKVDWVIPHQANVRIIQAVADHFGISMDKVVVEIEEMGNTSAATVIVAMDKAIKDGRIKRGQNILLTAFGAGITSGSLLMKY
ncbi:MAG: ketoacyl-ACP synthase III [Bdellovibrionaceae bacterium]|nr:ketoacyl-ACP synthase III [Pseudobdellovibrionaceae bacterium]